MEKNPQNHKKALKNSTKQKTLPPQQLDQIKEISLIIPTCTTGVVTPLSG